MSSILSFSPRISHSGWLSTWRWYIWQCLVLAWKRELGCPSVSSFSLPRARHWGSHQNVAARYFSCCLWWRKRLALLGGGSVSQCRQGFLNHNQELPPRWRLPVPWLERENFRGSVILRKQRYALKTAINILLLSYPWRTLCLRISNQQLKEFVQMVILFSKATNCELWCKWLTMFPNFHV